MHELGIAEAIIEIAARHAGEAQVTKVSVKIGHLRQVVPSALLFSFELVAMGTVADGAELNLDSVPAIGRCRTCAIDTRLDAFPLLCGDCGGADLEIVQGDELIVESIEVEEVHHADAVH